MFEQSHADPVGVTNPLHSGHQMTRLPPHSVAANHELARALIQTGNCEAARAAYKQAREGGLDDLAPTLLAQHWGSRIRASEVDDPAAGRPTLQSFLHFMGETPFTPNEWFAFMMQELEESGVEWISTLAENHTGMWPLKQLIPGARCLTMGPLEGALEWRLAGLGADAVVAIEGNRQNYLKCHALKALFPSLPIDFVEADLETADLPTGFDTIFCPGVLYHLHEPQHLLEKVRALEPRLFFLVTQLAFEPSHPGSALRNLGDDTSVQLQGQSYRGRFFNGERSGMDYLSGLDATRPSFWFYPDELRRLLSDLGFVMQDEYIVDLRQLGVAGLYVCSAPCARADLRFRISMATRLQRLLMSVLVRSLSKERMLSLMSLRG